MKLTTEQIETIEAFLTSQENGVAPYGGRSLACIRFGGSFLRGIIGAKLSPGRGLRVRKIDRELAAQMRAAGVKDADIARHFNVTRESIRFALGNKGEPQKVTVEEFLASRKAAE
jgi:hypothetical protein